MGISIRKFAAADGCDEKLVREAIKRGRLTALPDGRMDPALVGSSWRRSNRRKLADDMAPATDDRAPFARAEAERIKENYWALLLQLRYDRDSAAVVSVDDAAALVASEYAIVRNRILSLPSKLAPRLATMQKVEETRLLLEAEITNILEELTADDAPSKVRGRRAKAGAAGK